MSIHNLINKIKGHTIIDFTAFLYLIVVILVAFSSFGLGRLSVGSHIKQVDREVSIIQRPQGTHVDSVVTTPDTPKNTLEGAYIASKNGKLYYSLDCPGAKRILEKNIVRFTSASDAEKLGYTLASSCKHKNL